MTQDLAMRARSGGRVVVASQGARFLLQMVGMVVLSRLLGPEDFGLIAVVTAFLGVADVLRDLGLSSAAVQALHLSRQQATNLFWCNVLAGVVLAAIAVGAAPVVALLGGDGRLGPIMAAMSVTVVLNSLQAQFQAQLLRAFRFTYVAVSDLASVFAGLLVAVISASAGAGYWSLVAQSVMQSAVLLVARLLGSGFWPGLPRRASGMLGLLRYGLNLAGSQLLVYVSSNIDTVIMGSRFPPANVGYYKRSSQLVSLPLVQVMAPLTSVALATLSQLREDPASFWAYLRKAQAVTAYVGGLVLAALCANSTWVVVAVFGESWRPAWLSLSILCVAGIFQVGGYSVYWAFLALGATKDHLRYSLVSRSVLVLSVYLGSLCGETGIPWGYVIGVALAWPLGFVWLGKISAVRWTDVLEVPMRAVATSVSVAGVGFAATSAGPRDSPMSLLIFAAVLVSVVALAATFNPRMRADLCFVVTNGLGERARRRRSGGVRN